MRISELIYIILFSSVMSSGKGKRAAQGVALDAFDQYVMKLPAQAYRRW